MSGLKVVQFRIVDNRLVADPAEVTVTQSQTLVLFQLLIPGLSFADANPIRLLSGDGSFKGPWRDSSNTASLLDSYNVFGDFEYTVWVVRTAATPAPPGPFPLVFQTRLMIRNALP